MKLDARLLRYMSNEEFRVLTAVEMGSRNHEVVPTSLISTIADLRKGGAHKILGDLIKKKLVAKVQNTKYDGYRLTYGGYDYLSLKTFVKRGVISSVGNQIGVGKESDIYMVANEEGQLFVLKLQRLGRTSFRSVKENRDYLGHRKTTSWLYLSRLAAMKEYAFLTALHEAGFPCPKPISQSRHCIVMEYLDATPLCQMNPYMKGIDNEEGVTTNTTNAPSTELCQTEEPKRVETEGCDDNQNEHQEDHIETVDLNMVEKLYSECLNLILSFANRGLIHGDFNEFNLMIPDPAADDFHKAEDRPLIYVIDFPQMVSTLHENAKFYFDRDVECIKRFFEKRFGYTSEEYPRWETDVNPKIGIGYEEKNEQGQPIRLDAVVEASGFSKKLQKELNQLTQIQPQMNDQTESEDTDVSAEDVDDTESSQTADLQVLSEKLKATDLNSSAYTREVIREIIMKAQKTKDSRLSHKSDAHRNIIKKKGKAKVSLDVEF